MYVIERLGHDGRWRIIDRAKHVRPAVVEFLTMTRLPLTVADGARAVRASVTIAGTSTVSGMPVQLRDDRHGATEATVTA